MARPLSLLLGLWLLVSSAQAADTFIVKRVVDGDTLLLANGVRVRLIGIDTPEVHPSEKMERDSGGSKQREAVIRKLGERSARFVREIIEGRRVTLDYDQASAAHHHKDRYGRTLAYVHFEPPPCEKLELWVADSVCELDSYDEGFLNALILEAGYASVYTRFPFQYADQFRRLEAEARRDKRGLWRPEPRETRGSPDTESASAKKEPAGPTRLTWAQPH